MSGTGCHDKRLLIQAEWDGELDAADAAALAAHVEGCAACAALRAELAGVSGRVRAEATRFAAPASLRAAVRPAAPARHYWAYGGAFGAGMALAAGLAAVLVLPRGGTAMPDVVAAHIRALQPGHLVDVVSSDRHTVKPWFDGRLDYAPPVRDFAGAGYRLVGGRLDYVAGRPVAALVYGRDKHLIDVFVWPGGQPGSSGTVQGYNVIAWSQGGMNFRAVSDLNTRELGALAGLLRSPDK